MSELGKVEVRVYPVGQGLFSALLYIPTIRSAPHKCKCGPFSLVYDCGASESGKVTSSLGRSIIHFSNDRVLREHVNVLVISHLHWDHVAGLPHLLSLVDVDEVLLPYLTPCERFLSLITEPLPYRQWYLQFIADPVSFLMDFGVRRITLIGSVPEEPKESPPRYGEGGEGGEGGTDVPLENERPGEWTIAPLDEKAWVPIEEKVKEDRYKELQRQEDLLFRRIRRIGEEEQKRKERLVSEVYFMEKPSTLTGYCYCDHDRRYGQIIALVPFLVKENVQLDKENFKKLLEECGNLGQASRGDTLDSCISSSQLLSLLMKRECISKLKKFYEDMLGKRHLNEHSLVINVKFYDLDKQIKDSSMLFSRLEHIDGSRITYNMGRCSPEQGAGFLFTGDFSHSGEAKRNDYFKKLLKYYYRDAVIEGLSFYQVPHHGSINGWSNEISCLRSTVSAVSYGIYNPYGHPDSDHMRNILRRSNYLIKVNEKSEIFRGIWAVCKK